MNSTRHCVPLLALLAVGCGSSGSDTMEGGPVQLGPATDTSTSDPQPNAGAAGDTAAPAPSDTSDSEPAVTATDPEVAPDPMEADPGIDDVTEADPADNCEDRRVSYATPCHGDPNPCNIDSGYPGDEYCLLPPAPEEGFQIHIGPKDYGDPAEIAKYLIEPNQEFNNSVLGHIPLEEDVWFNRINVQMRPGSHHWISSVIAGKPEERVYDGTSCEGAQQIGSIGGGQNLIYDNPPGGVQAPENEGLGRSLSGNSSLCMNLHAYNFTEEPALRELWINVYTVDESEVTQRGRSIGVVGGFGLNVPPGASETLTYTQAFSEPGRIIQLYGHRHVWTPRFAVRLNDDLIYDSWDWQESRVFNYDSLTENPPPNPDLQVDGAVSGVLEVNAGDEVTFSCFIENESDITLRWANELYTGEMCNLWGTAVGTSLSGTRF